MSPSNYLYDATLHAGKLQMMTEKYLYLTYHGGRHGTLGVRSPHSDEDDDIWLLHGSISAGDCLVCGTHFYKILYTFYKIKRTA